MVTHLIALDATFDHLPDDTEKTLVGSSLHQGAIVALATGLTLCGPRRGLPWFIGNQIKLILPREGRRSPYMPLPDILVHPTLTNASRTSLVLATDGPPALVIEVASPSTVYSSDLNLTDERGKPGVYEAIGVAEYIVFDPTAEFVPEQLWARRRVAGKFVLWEPDEDGRWVSAALGGSPSRRRGRCCASTIGRVALSRSPRRWRISSMSESGGSPHWRRSCGACAATSPFSPSSPARPSDLPWPKARSRPAPPGSGRRR